MTTAANIIERAQTLLRDDESDNAGVVWPDSDLIEWVSEGIQVIASLRPDAMTETANIPLVAGAAQTLPDEYAALLSVEGTVVVHPDGSVTVEQEATVADSRMVRRFGKKRCLASQAPGPCGQIGADYRVRSFSISPYNQRDFRVEPPVPAGASVEIRATVTKVAPALSLGDRNKPLPVQSKYDAALLNWVMHRAYSSEIESEYATASREQHLRAFYSVLNGTYFADSRLASGYVLGREGTGDPRSGAPRELREFGR